MKILNRYVLKPVIPVLFTLLFISCKEGQSTNESTYDRPNVIIVMTDDQGYGDLAYHGNPVVKTPNLDALAEQALELTNFHTGTTCAPTRAGLLTGRNANRNNAWHTIAGCSILLEDEETMAQVFERNGYRTAMIGKWHLGDNYPFRPHDRGFQEAFYHGGGGVNQTPDFWNNDYFNDTYFRNGTPEKTKGYCTDVWFNETIEYIENSKEEPFFVYLAPNAAHGPFNVPEEYLRMYEDAPLTDLQKRFYGMVTNIDDNIGKLTTYLKESGQFDNTVLIFTTDNGTALGIANDDEGNELGFNAGLRDKKGSHYDGGHRVPFFMSWPDGNIMQKTALTELAAHVDLLPTLADLTGISFEPKKPMDGKSIADVLRGKKNSLDRMLIIDTQRNQFPEKGRNACVMSGEWRLVNGNELYNIFEDPGQQKNIAEKYPDRVKAMQVYYEEWWASIEPDIRYAEIPIGVLAENPVLITVHDMHTTQNLPWNQVQIRKGTAFPDGFYSIKVNVDGDYRFKMYRYPPESGLALNASAEEIQGTVFRDALPPGTALQPSRAEIILGETTITSEVDANSPFVTLTAKLNKGSYRLQSNFIDSLGKKMSSYYTEIEKL